jgi:RNA polymerase sigma-70 factor (ECF subfamily)
MVRLADGDREAFTCVFEELWPEVLGFVRRVVPTPSDAEDVAQQALMKVFFRIAEFDTQRDGIAWAFGIAAFEIKTLRRRTQRRREVAEPGREAPDPARSPEQVVLDEELDRALLSALGELSSSDRATLMLSDGSAVTITDAARRKRRQRALERLRAIWRRLYA